MILITNIITLNIIRIQQSNSVQAIPKQSFGLVIYIKSLSN